MRATRATRATHGETTTPAEKGERTEEERARQSLRIWGGGGALVALALSLAIGLPLAQRHAARYAVAPDLSASGFPLASSWAAPLAGPLVGIILLGAAVGITLYAWALNPYARSRPFWHADYFWRIAVLAVLGWTLVSNGRAAVEDITVAVPEQVTGLAQSHSVSQGLILRSYALDMGTMSYTVGEQQAHAFPSSCVVITYGPESHIAFSVRALPHTAPPHVC